MIVIHHTAHQMAIIHQAQVMILDLVIQAGLILAAALIKDFKLTPAMLPELIRLLKELLTSGKAYRVDVKEWREQRSLSQNALMWVWLDIISKELKPNDQQHKDEVWHEYFKQYFCPAKSITMPAGKDVIVKSTKLLDVGEMCHYMTQIHNWAAGHMLALPVPENSEYKQNLDKQEA